MEGERRMPKKVSKKKLSEMRKDLDNKMNWKKNYPKKKKKTSLKKIRSSFSDCSYMSALWSARKRSKYV
jgi:hypothetical protein